MKTAVVLADIHINKNNRPEDTLAVLRQIMQYAVKNKVDFVYILGDVYERARPHNSEKVIFEKFVKYLSSKDIEVIILAGNHDMSADGVSTVEEFGILELPNVSLKSNPCMVTLGKYNIWLGHMLVQGAKLGPVDYQAHSPVSLQSILDKYEASAYLLGDVHKAQKLNDNPPVLYVGSPERTDFGERNEKKGFTLLTATNEKLEYKFIPLDTRPMIQFDLEYANLEDWLSNSGDYEKSPDTTEALVKVKITCDRDEYRKIDEKIIKEHLKDARNVTIEYDIVKTTRVRSKKIKESSSPVKAFETYAQLNEFDQETIKLGLQIMKETR
jgi:DNA repair exonuclease SbcCD nuclease subunit